MEKGFFQTAEKLNNEHRRTRRWHKVITIMAAVVVFCTTYALILPAITWERHLLCDMKEHTHTASCYAETVITPETRELTCSTAEHTHSDSCYEEVTTYTCGLEEGENHQHTADCTVTERVLTCEQAEHAHSDDCYHITPAVTEKQLVCTKPEHVHTDACFDAPPSSDSGYYCGYAEHTHNDSCYFEDGSLRCTMREHTHTLKCKINDSADVETAADWESTFADVKLTGNRGKDVLAIAETQIGYTESSKNFVIDDEKTGEVRGYSRYGDWFGNPYGDWCAMFCAFCLDYAGVDNMPVDANCQTWIEKLTKEGLYHEAGSYDPKPGDLVFYCWDKPEEDKDRCGDHVGFVCEVVDAVAATETTEAVPTMLKTIEGNWSDSVCQLDRELNSDDIIGYAELPKAFTVTYDGDDFTVTAKYNADAKIPADAKLLAEKISEDSEIYQQYYRQSVEAMLENSPATSEDELAISYLQFYDIGFYVNGEEIEPEGPVDIVITNNDTIEIQSDEKASAIHFGSEGTEILDVSTEVPAEQDAESAFSFTQESFSITGVVVAGTNYNATNSISNGDTVIVATWRGNGTSTDTTYYLNTTSTNNRLVLSANTTAIWTVEEYNGAKYLKVDNQYLTVSNGQSGLTTNRGIAATLTYNSAGYWDIAYNGQYLNEYWGHGNGTAGGYGTPGSGDDGSKWLVLKKETTPDISGAPAVGSITGVQTDTLVVGEWYIIYGGNHGRALNASNINRAETLSTYPTNGGTVTYYGNADVVWQWTGDGFRNRDGKYLRVGANGPSNWLANYWLDDNPDDSIYNAVYNSTYRIVYQSQDAWGLKYNKVYIHAWENVVQAVTETALGPVQQSAEPIYLAQVTGNPQGPHDNHPRTSTTDTPDMRDLVIYNFDTTTGSVKGLAGVEYTLYDADGKEVARYMTTNDFVVPIGRLTPGATYTIRQTSVPDGYVVVSQDKQFTVSNDGTALIGAFFDYNADDYAPDKTAAVVDYDNRTYQVDLKAKQSLYDYTIDNTNFNMVVDQSNSMLFPSELTDTGKKVTFYRNGSGYNTHNSDALNNLGLDKNQTYYFIADEATSSTVYALFWDGSGWVYQDASYYAKAQNRADGCEHNIMDGTNVPKFASSGSAYAQGDNADGNGVIVHGGDINYSLDSIYDFKHKVNKVDTYFDWNTYTLYIGSQYNRLHDLQQAMAILCNTLSSMTSNATIRLETFDKFVETCQSYDLGSDGSGVTDVIAAVNHIECAGGTRQDYAFRHLIRTYYDTTNYPSDVNKTGEQLHDHLNTGKDEYVILVTDGAPNGTTMDNVVNAANELKNHNNRTTIVTAGLSLKHVQGGSDMLKNAATNPSWSYAADTAGALSDYMTQMLFRIANKENRNYKTTVTDEISDSFYPINPDTKEALTDGTTIGLDGKVITLPRWNQPPYGTVRYNSATDTWYVEWNGQTLNYGATWNGRIYLKAKEDFIGGNSIDTNKSANVSLTDIRTNKTVASTDLETPTVNVKLLEMNQVSSEETVFLGDKVSVQEKIKALYDQLEFTKLVDNGDSVHNKSNASSTPGLEKKTFTPAYAWAKDLTKDDWDKLFDGETLTLPYTYDDDSSHGPVGYFTVKLTKTGDGSSFDEHATTHTGNAVETYTLQVVYTPYKLGEGDGEQKREKNVHNAGKGPGDEVKEPETSNNTHKVNVVDGKITVIKELTAKLKSNAAQTFTFKLQRQVDGKFVDTGDPITVTVNANSTEGRVVIPDLPRGTYRVEEQIGENAEYYVKEMTVVTGDANTNCHQEDAEAVTFTIGEDSNGNDLIEYVTTGGYHDVYSKLRDGYTGINGISYETLKVVNDKVTYTADIPVIKNWDSAIGDDYHGLDVYVALYQNDEPVVDESGNVWALRLNDSNKWNGTFTVPLESKNEDVSKLGYTVRELSEVTSAESAVLTRAIVMNAPNAEQSIVYYKDACKEGMIKIGDSFFGVSTEAGMVPDAKGKPVYTLTAYNSKAYALPETGGVGLAPIYTLGAMLMASAFVCGYFLRRKAERRHR